jgi:hypothetical protein
MQRIGMVVPLILSMPASVGIVWLQTSGYLKQLVGYMLLSPAEVHYIVIQALGYML